MEGSDILRRDQRLAYKIAYFVTTFFMACHVIFVFMFFYCGADVLGVISFISVLCYLACYYMLATHRLNAYARTVFWEFTIFTMAAIMYMGMNYGFELYDIGFLPIVFAVQYFSARLGNSNFKGYRFCAVIIITYVFAVVYNIVNGSTYTLPEQLGNVLNVVNILLTSFAVTVVFAALMNALAANVNTLSDRAEIDELTGLYNRYFMVDHLNRLTRQMQDGVPVWAAMLDIDDFKKVNDTYGHNCGDEVLKGIADIIRTSCGADNVSRWGGEEFLIAGRDGTEVLGMLRKEVESHVFAFEGVEFKCTVTIGYSYLKPGQSVEDWVDISDKNLYVGKFTGKNRVIGSGASESAAGKDDAGSQDPASGTL